MFFIGAAHRLGIRTTRAPNDQDAIDEIDRWTAAQARSVDNALSGLLGDMEADALLIYEAAGLPTRPGHYARAPGEREWQFVARTLLPQDRWTLVQDYPPEEGWRFATLGTLGLHEPAGSPAIGAARVLCECQSLRDSPEARHEATSALLERSVRLGAAWSELGRGETLAALEPARSTLPKESRGD